MVPVATHAHYVSRKIWLQAPPMALCEFCSAMPVVGKREPLGTIAALGMWGIARCAEGHSREGCVGRTRVFAGEWGEA